MMKKYENQSILPSIPCIISRNNIQKLPIISQCIKIGFHSYIIADPALMVYLREKWHKLRNPSQWRNVEKLTARWWLHWQK